MDLKMCADRLDHVVRKSFNSEKRNYCALLLHDRHYTADEKTLYIMAWVCFNQSSLPHLVPLNMRKKVQWSEKSNSKTTADESRKHEGTKHFHLSLLLLALLKLYEISLLVENHLMQL